MPMLDWLWKTHPECGRHHSRWDKGKQPSVYWHAHINALLRLLTVGVMWRAALNSCSLDFPTIMHYNLELGTKVNLFFLGLFSYFTTKETKTYLPRWLTIKAPSRKQHGKWNLPCDFFFLRQSLSVAQANSALLCSQEVTLLETRRCGSFCLWCRVSHTLGLCSTSESHLSGKLCRVVCLGMHLGPQSQSLTSGTLHRYRRTSPTYWITVTPCCRQSAQKREAENLGARTQVAPGRERNK